MSYFKKEATKLASLFAEVDKHAPAPVRKTAKPRPDVQAGARSGWQWLSRYQVVIALLVGFLCGVTPTIYQTLQSVEYDRVVTNPEIRNLTVMNNFFPGTNSFMANLRIDIFLLQTDARVLETLSTDVRNSAFVVREELSTKLEDAGSTMKKLGKTLAQMIDTINQMQQYNICSVCHAGTILQSQYERLKSMSSFSLALDTLRNTPEHNFTQSSPCFGRTEELMSEFFLDADTVLNDVELLSVAYDFINRKINSEWSTYQARLEELSKMWWPSRSEREDIRKSLELLDRIENKIYEAFRSPRVLEYDVVDAQDGFVTLQARLKQPPMDGDLPLRLGQVVDEFGQYLLGVDRKPVVKGGEKDEKGDKKIDEKAGNDSS